MTGTADARPSTRSLTLFTAAMFALAASLALCAWAYAVTHRWDYQKEGRLIVRTDTFTGRTEMFSPQYGWREAPTRGR